MLKNKFMKKIGTGLLICTLALGITAMQKPTEAKAHMAPQNYYTDLGNNYTYLYSMEIGGQYNLGVRYIQAALNQMGYTCNPDGYFGQATKNAVILFQSAHGLTQDGIVGNETRHQISYHYITPSR
jgi:peptidoglycan hydrolase-like protein with peptidoglycan-binding domain